jgi:hypothetical protein
MEKTQETVKPQEIASEVIKEHAQVKPEAIAKPEYKIPKKLEESMVSKLLELEPESHDQQIEELLGIAEAQGILNAISIAKKLKNPHLEDDLHRVLVQFYLKMDPAKIKVNKEVGHVLEMVLYEVTMPQEDIAEGKTFKDFVSAMEQFYAGMATAQNDVSNHSIVLEIGIPMVGEEIVFYAAVPRKRKQMFEKQIEALFHNVKLEEKKSDYNIFKPEGVGAGAILSLENNPVLPIKTYDKFDIDPLLVIVNAFSKLQKIGEGAALQIIVSSDDGEFHKKIKWVTDDMRKGKPFKEALKYTEGMLSELTSAFGELFKPSKKEEEKDPSKNFVDENLLKLLDEKASRPAMLANVRLLVSAGDPEKAYSILKELESAFVQFKEMQGNSLRFRDAMGKQLDELFYKFSFRLFDRGEAVYLNTAELSSIFHFPIGVSSISQLKYMKSKDAPPPLNLPEDGLLLGENAYRGKKTGVYVRVPDRRRHFYIIGQTGTGKTNLMKDMIIQDIENGDGVCYIDPHGSDLEDILERIPKERLEDVVYFNPADISRPMALNMLEYDEKYPEQKSFVVNELLGIFKKLYGSSPESMGPMFETYFRNATMLVVEDPKSGNTLLDIARVMSNKNFRDYKLSQCNNPVVLSFWKEIAEKTGGEASLQNMVPYITSKFDNFMSNEIMRPIIAQEKSSFNFRQIMDQKKIFLVNLSKGRLGDINSHLLGLIVVGKILMASLSRVDIPEDERPDFYLYIDEFQNVTTDSIATILSEARKYRLGMVMAHQFIGQLEENIKKAVFGNVGSMIVFRIGAEDAEFLQKQFEPVFDAKDLMNISNYNAYLKILIDGHTSRPFNIRTLSLKKGDPSMKQGIIEMSSLKYGRPREEIETEIRKKYSV